MRPPDQVRTEVAGGGDVADQPTAVLAALPYAHDFAREEEARRHEEMAYLLRAQGAFAEALRHDGAAAMLRHQFETDRR